jgi:hypothetical protein
MSMMLADRTVPIGNFRAMLMYLTQLPKNAIHSLNIVCHSPDFQTLVFKRDFIFSESTGETKVADPDPQAKPFSDVNMSDLINLASMESLETGEGLIKMEDVRSSFAQDAELRLFCIGNGATESLAQGLANLFQVKVVSFTDATIKFRVEVIEGTEVSNVPALTKKILVRPRFGTALFEFDFFDQMITEDAAKTGRFMAYPRRP